MEREKISTKQARKAVVVCALGILLVGCFGCSKRYDNLPVYSSIPFWDLENTSVGRFKTSYLARQIHAYFRGNVHGPIAVATFVNIDNLYGSSTFGRMLGEQMMSELSMLGYDIIELRHADALQVLDDEGEFGLSRDVSVLKRVQNVSAIVLGTYIASPERVYLNARLIDPASSMVISAGSVEMKRTDEISRMLRTSTLPATLERVPVRQIGRESMPQAAYWPYPPQVGFQAQRFQDEEQFYPEQRQEDSTNLPAPLPNTPPTAIPLPPSAKLEPTT